jgi:hypothetical protein
VSHQNDSATDKAEGCRDNESEYNHAKVVDVHDVAEHGHPSQPDQVDDKIPKRVRQTTGDRRPDGEDQPGRDRAHKHQAKRERKRVGQPNWQQKSQPIEKATRE